MAEQPLPVVMRPEVWLAGLMDLATEDKTVMLQVMTNIGEEQNLSLGAKLPIPFTSEIDTVDRGELGSEIAFPIPNADLDTLVIDQNKITPYLIPNEIRSRITMPTIGDYMRQMNKSRQRMFEIYTIAKHKSLAKMSAVLDEITVDNIGDLFLDIQKGMSQSLIPTIGRYIVLSDDVYRILQGYFAKRATPLGDDVNKSGIVARAFGFDIYISSYVDTMIFGHRRGHVYAQTISQVDVENYTPRLSLLVNAHSVFGTTATRHGAWLGVVEVTTKKKITSSGIKLNMPNAVLDPEEEEEKAQKGLQYQAPKGEEKKTPLKPAKPPTKKELDAMKKQQKLEELARQAEEEERLRLEEEARTQGNSGEVDQIEGDGEIPPLGEAGSDDSDQEV